MTLNKNLKIVLNIFSILFLIVISSLIYFLVFKSTYYETHELNRRLYKERDRYIRGSILDRNGEIIAYTDKESKKRIYPYGESLLHPLGYFDVKYGLSGLEQTLDEYLREPSGVISKVRRFLNKENNNHGSDVKLTLDVDIQKYAYDILGDNKGAIVLMNPKTGEIYALVSKPSFDPNLIRELWDDISNSSNSPFYNRAINGQYPPGSIFKVITSASAIDNINGVLDRVFEDNGFISFNNDEKLYNQNRKAYDRITLKEAFVNSSNVVFGNFALELGNDKLRNYAERFYFNRSMSVEFLNISKSYFPKLNKNEEGLIAQTGIGQGSILSTPFMMATISSIIANKGMLKKPYIVSEILDSNSNIINKTRERNLSRVISIKTSNIILDYMKSVVSTNLSHIKEFSYIKAAGKTGTADHKKNGIDGIPHSVFVGFAPYDDPKVSIATIVEEGGEGRGVASEISAKVMYYALQVVK